MPESILTREQVDELWSEEENKDSSSWSRTEFGNYLFDAKSYDNFTYGN